MQCREFLKTGASALALAVLLPGALGAEEKAPGAAAPKRALKKGIMWGMAGVGGSVLEKMKAIKEAGFNGAEMMSRMDVDEVLRARDETGVAIPSVSCGQHSRGLSHLDAAKRAEAVGGIKQALRDAKRYGATSILVVAGGVN